MIDPVELSYSFSPIAARQQIRPSNSSGTPTQGAGCLWWIAAPTNDRWKPWAVLVPVNPLSSWTHPWYIPVNDHTLLRDLPHEELHMAPPKMVYQLRITLFDTQPKIWRRILISTSATFWDLHSAIQNVFHWNHSHLHQFHYEDKIAKKPPWFGIPTDEDYMYDIEILPSWKHKISKYLNLEEPYLRYVYDLGDNWIHMIELENILPAEKGVAYPVCLDGKQNAPPDDIGGVHGYEEMLEILSDPTDEEYGDTKSWVESMKGGPFDPKHFDPKEVQFMNPKQRYRKSFE